jgi:hypothetical protein
MARIVLGALIQDIRGSIAGSTFSAWKGKNYLKNKAVTIANPQTAVQMARRGNFGASVSAWRGIPPSGQALWEEYAQGTRMENSKNGIVGAGGIIPMLGQTKSGFNAYIGVNQNINGAGLTRVAVPPAVPEPDQPTIAITGTTTWKIVILPSATVHLRTGDHILEIWLKGDWKGAHAYICRTVTIPEPPANPPSFNIDHIRVGTGTNIQEVLFSAAKGGQDVPVLLQARIVRYDGYVSMPTQLYHLTVTT